LREKVSLAIALLQRSKRTKLDACVELLTLRRMRKAHPFRPSSALRQGEVGEGALGLPGRPLPDAAEG
jgi:hypothetical protein